MQDDTVFEAESQSATNQDLLTEVLRQGAQKLLAQAIECEVEVFLSQHQSALPNGRQQYVRNGYLPEREVQTGIGEVRVSVPRIRDRARIKSEAQFHSRIVPNYLRRSHKMADFLPLLYLKGISTGDFKEVLTGLFGTVAQGVSPGVISRLKGHWEEEHMQWSQRSLAAEHYVYWWVDGIYFKARMAESKDCVLVILGVKASGTKELVALVDGYRESKESWLDLLNDVKRRGLTQAPKVSVGDGALGFWGALNEVYSQSRHQRCWFHKMGNVLAHFPQNLQAQVKSDLQQIWLSDKRSKAYQAFDTFIKKYALKYPKATTCLQKDKEELLTFYDFPAEHWKSLRTTNPIESIFATVRHRTRKSKGCFSRETILAMAYKLCCSAERHWRAIHGFKRLGEVIEGVRFRDGIRQDKLTPNELKEELKNAA